MIWDIADLSRVEFDRPLDRALLARCLRIVGAEGEAVAGRSRTEDAEVGWSFEPERTWSPASHSLVVDPILEDLAGNSLERVFDRDLDRDRAGPAGPAVLTFDPVA